VIGCKAPDHATFSEFRGFNNDEKDDRYNSSQGMYEARCGFENVMLTWTGPEYMYHMLKHNSIAIPEEGFSILRLFALRDWHNKGGYGILANEDDEDAQPFIVGFDELRRDARNSRYNTPEMNDEDCNLLWRSHYSHIVSKYAGDQLLKW
jgi:inositol oxygenase